jgi:glycosyltransferase involved in cell wall biosynthesis
VLFVRTVGHGSLDLYSQRLAGRLGVPVLDSDVYARTAELFNAPPLSRRSLRGLGVDAAFVRRLRRVQGLVHLPNHHLGRSGAFLSNPYIVTVHDLIRYFDRDGFGELIHRPNARDRALLRLDLRGIRRATAVIAVSAHTRRNVVERLAVPHERVFVVHEGIDHDVFRPVATGPIDGPYLLHVGSEQPRLVKVGAPGGPEAPFRARTLAAVRALGLERDVVFTGRVAEEELAGYYSGASCLACPRSTRASASPRSRRWRAGVRRSSRRPRRFRRWWGRRRSRFPRRDVDALVEAIRTILVDPGVAEELRRRGLERARSFSWERTARETRAVYADVAERRDPRRVEERRLVELRPGARRAGAERPGATGRAGRSPARRRAGRRAHRRDLPRAPHSLAQASRGDHPLVLGELPEVDHRSGRSLREESALSLGHPRSRYKGSHSANAARLCVRLWSCGSGS